MSGSKEAVVLDYSSALLKHVVEPLTADNTEAAIAVMHHYSLLREDLDSLAEITSWNQGDDPFTKLSPKVKAAFTRAYNKNPVISVFASAPTIKKKKRGGGGGDAMWGSEDEEEEEEETATESQDITADALIVKKNEKKTQSKVSEGGPANSKGRGGGRKPTAGRKPKK